MRNTTLVIVNENPELIPRVIRAFLVYGLSHRKIESEILKLPALDNGGGYVAMDILHHFNIKGNQKNVLNDISIFDLIHGTEDKLFKEGLSLLLNYEIDTYVDDYEQNKIFNSEFITEIELEKLGNREPEKSKLKSGTRYKTNAKISKTVIVLNGFKCLNNPEHRSFIDKKGNQYVEAHHFIPMKYQEDFNFINLDRKENIVSLCPNCHKAIHLGNMNERDLIIQKIFLLKKKELEIFKLDISQIKRLYR